MPFATEFNHVDDDGNPEFWPYLRDEVTLARPWAIPGTPGLMHRVGGLEKADGTGNIDYTPENHERMVNLRAAKVAAIAADIPPIRGARATPMPTCSSSDGAPRGPRSTPPCNAGGGPATRWRGCTSCTSTRCRRISARSCGRYRKVIVPELNSGQLCNILRAEYLVDATALTKVQGLPFKSREIEAAIDEALDELGTVSTNPAGRSK